MSTRENHPPGARAPDRSLPARPADLLDIVPCALMEVNIDAGGHRAIPYFSRHASDMYGDSPTDVVMPEMLGTVLAHTMSQSHPEMKVIFTSGFARPALEHGGRALDGPLLQKPVPAAELLRQIAAVLAP